MADPVTAVRLDAQRVRDILETCLYKDGEDTTGHVPVRGVVVNFGFRPAGLEARRAEIIALMSELPDQFMHSKAGGWSFLNACQDRHGTQWGEHRDIEALVCLGIGIGRAKWLFPREMWSAFPGGMPYFVVLDGE